MMLCFGIAVGAAENEQITTCNRTLNVICDNLDGLFFVRMQHCRIRGWVVVEASLRHMPKGAKPSNGYFGESITRFGAQKYIAQQFKRKQAHLNCFINSHI